MADRLTVGSGGNERQGTIGAVQRMVQNLGIAIDTAVAAALIRVHSGPPGLILGIREAWGYATITLLLFCLCCPVFNNLWCADAEQVMTGVQ